MSQSNQPLEAHAAKPSDVPTAPRPTRPPRNQRAPVGEPQPKPAPVARKQEQAPAPEKGKGPVVEEAAPRKLSLRELFAPAEESAEDDLDSPASSIDAVIKRAGLKAEEFDELEILVGEDAQPMKLKDLKSKVGQLADLETREIRFERRRVAQEGEIIRGQQEIKELLALMPPSALTPKLIDQVRRAHDTKVARERELTIEHIPEWRKESVMAADVKGMEDYLQTYGFPAGFLGTLNDHRALKMIRDNYLMMKKIDAAMAEVTIPKETTHKPSSKGKRAPSRPGPELSNRRAGMRPTQKDNLMSIFTKE